ncbi:T9SS type A sorting domain-containing protein [Lewinella sp. LCG006]|uniref:T9SS type A sorting domain-containing protein n=1 Tax=Lewinella sp. LCG006 TaxID=3231911 RepID=UPI00345F9442
MKILKTFFTLFLLLSSLSAYSQVFSSCVQGTIRVDGNATLELCQGDGLDDTIRFRSSPQATPYAYIVVNEDDIIVYASTSSFINFEDLPDGNLRVFSVSYIGQFLGQVGDNYLEATLGSFCYRLSGNFISISNLTPMGGNVMTAAGETAITLCINDGVTNVVDFTSTSEFTPYVYVITDDNNNILGTSPDGTVDFSDAGIGVCRVWGLAYVGDYLGQVGDDLLTTNLASACYELSMNYVEVTRLFPDAGTLTYADGSETFVSCSVLEPTGTVSLVSTHDPATDFAFVIVNSTTGLVQSVTTATEIDLALIPVGAYRIFGVAYTGTLTPAPGAAFNPDQLSSECADLSDNNLSFIKRVQNADDVLLEDGSSEVTICVGDGIDDFLTFTSTYTGADNFTYIITNEGNFVLGVSADPTINFEGAGAGICRVWGLAYSGNLLVEEGINIGAPTLLSDECFDLSDGFVLVNRNGPIGGDIAYADGTDSFLSCSTLEPTGTVEFVVDGNDPNASYAFLLVNNSDNTVAAIVTSGSIDLTAFAAGAYTVYGVSYIDGIALTVGDVFDPAAVGASCFDLSENTLSLTKRVLNADDVILADGSTETTICVGDGNPDVLTFASTYAGDDNFVYVITNEGNFVLGTSADGIVDFDTAEPGICRVWGVAYSGNLTINVGDNLGGGQALSDECFDLSDGFVVINRNGPDGGIVSLEDGSTSYVECMAGSGNTLTFVATDADPNLAYVYIVVDVETDLIAAIVEGNDLDLNQLPLGTYEVYGLSYLDNLSVAVGDTFTGATLADVCFDLSDNSVSVINRSVSVSEITFEDGSTVAAICPNDGVVDILNFVTDYSGDDNLAFLVTDTDNTVLEILAGPSTNFEDYTGDFVRVWAVAFSGNFLLQSGVTIEAGTQISDDCFDLSDNFLLVDLRGPDGGELRLADGETTAFVCVSDGIADVLDVQTTAPEGTNYVYVITDENNIILNTSTSPQIDFENAPAGICRIWGLAYLGNLTAAIGDNAATTDLASDCFDLSDNFITVIRTFVDGGTVSLEDGTTNTFACGNDGEADFFIFQNTSTATDESYAYIVTDNQNNILAVLAGNSVDLDQAAPGECRVWGLSYSGEIIAEVGQNAAEVALTDACFELSSNFVTVIRDQVDGGMVSLADGNTTINICPNDDVADILSFVNTGISTANYTYVITDVNNNILNNIGSAPFDFNEISVPAEIRVWGVAFSGQLMLTGGNIETTELSNRCYDASDNYVTIIRETPQGGTISTTEGATSLYLCTDDGISDLYAFAASGASNTDYAFLITDENNNILDILTNTNEADFEGAPNGTCRVWGVAYTGTLLAEVGDNAATIALSNDCYDLTDNFVTVVRGELNAGTISTTIGTGDRYTCPGDGVADVLTFSNQGTGSGNFTYVLTNADNIIIDIIIGGNTYDFEFLPEGEYRMWGFVFTGDLLAEIGLDAGNADLSTACFDLSDNYITIYNITPAAGLIFVEGGAEEVTLCIGDGIPDPFTVSVFGASAAAYTYLVVDEDSILVGNLNDPTFNFENAAPGDWRIYGLSYTGSLSVLPGANIFEDQLASGCYDLTNNFVFVDKTYVDGGEIYTDLGASVVYVCPDGVADFTNFVNSGSSTEATYSYVLTTQGNIVLQVLSGNTIDFEQAAGLDALRMWGISYTGDLNLSIGNVITAVEISNGCYDLSNNFVDIFIDTPDGGIISFEGGADSLRLCHSNFMPGPLVLTTSTANVGYAYLVTDDQNIVLQVSEPTDGIVNLDNFEPGFYRIWAVSYTGTLLVEPGDDAAAVQLASSCFELSENFLTVERTESLDAGNVSTMSGEEIIYICPQDGMADIVILDNDTDDPNYRYIITDDENNILFGDIESNIIDFDPSAPGICRVYGVVYTGEFDPTFMADITTSALSSDCWAISNNYITLVRQTPDGGTVSTDEGSIDVELIVNDGQADVVTFINTGIELTTYAYVITDENNDILGLSTTGVIDFEGVPAGICRVWGLSYTGNITVGVGDSAEGILTDDCYDLSDNFVTVTRIELENLVPGGNTNASLPNTDRVVINLYPNPASDQINVQVTVPSSLLTEQQVVSCFDINGMLLFQQALSPVAGTNQSSLNISQLQAGMYLLRWYDGEQVIVTRFIKE